MGFPVLPFSAAPLELPLAVKAGDHGASITVHLVGGDGGYLYLPGGVTVAFSAVEQSPRPIKERRMPRTFGGSAAIPVVGTVDLTTLTYGSGGTVDGHTVLAGRTTTFSAPANAAAVVAQLVYTFGASAASLDGGNHLLFTGTLTGGTALTALGLAVPLVTGDPSDSSLVSYVLQSSDTASAGVFDIAFTVTVPTGQVITFPAGTLAIY